MNKGKITVKHYLNSRAKPINSGDKKYLPLYIQIISKGKRAQLKSRIPSSLESYRSYTESYFAEKHECNLIGEGYFTSDCLQHIREKQVFPFCSLLEDEINILTEIIRSIRDYHGAAFSLTNLGNFYDLHLKDVFVLLEESVQKMYLKELNRIFIESTKNTVNRRLFKLSNFFMHYTNWNANFCEFYETTYEVLPSEIKYLENQLCPSLKIEIKALMAFHSRLNPLKRYMDKAEKGQFPHINLNDWNDSGKDFITRDFINIFGKQKANEYMSSIDKIITRELEASQLMA